MKHSRRRRRKKRSYFTSELAQLAFARPRRRIALRSRGRLHPYPPALALVRCMSLSLLPPSAARRDGDGVKKVAHNTWAPQSRVRGSHGLVGGVDPCLLQYQIWLHSKFKMKEGEGGPQLGNAT